MNYLALFSEHNVALLSDWVKEMGELYVDVDYPFLGASGDRYFIHSMQDLKDLVARLDHPAIGLTIFRRLQFSIKGIADDSLLDRAMDAVPDGQWYHIFSLHDRYPKACSNIGTGASHEELRQDFSIHAGEEIRLGQDPFDYPHDIPLGLNPDVFILQVTKNQNSYERYEKHPHIYRAAIAEWFE